MPSNHTIMVVDDVPHNLEIVRDILASQGYTATTAISGDRALKRLQKHVPDLILLDVQMPGIDGFETCRQIKEHPEWQAIPIIFLTALTDTQSIVRGFAAGAVDYVSKPFREEELLARVRTHLQLHTLNKNLEHTLSELKTTQAELVQSEKMSALGGMVAGVAHEINNPINFIKGNITHLHDYFTDLENLLALYEKEYPQSNPSIQSKQEDIELNLLFQDAGNILNSMLIGSERIQKIVLNLRNFSRLDESARKTVDIHHGIDSTLSLLQHRLRAGNSAENSTEIVAGNSADHNHSRIEIVREYGSLPVITCYPRELNQAFLNIINNAIDAIREDEEHNELSERDLSAREVPERQLPRIRIQTEALKDDQICISISNTGRSIPQSDHKRIFDPFFTTKLVGSGMGLGLSISYSIIQKHGGKITVISQPGEDTTFKVTLPLELASAPLWNPC